MVLPQEIGDAAQNGDRDRVIAWLNAGGSIDDVDEDGYTLVHCCACGNRGAADIDDKHIACPVPLTVRGTRALVSFAPLAFELFYAARHNAVLRRSPFRPRKNVSLAPRVPMSTLPRNCRRH